VLRGERRAILRKAMRIPVKRSIRTVVLLVAVVGCLARSAPSIPLQQVRMATYSVSLPGGWWFIKNESVDQIQTCNIRTGKCTGTGGGFPLAGAVFITLTPVDNLPDHQQYATVRDIVSTVPHAGMAAATVSRVELRSDGGARECQVARSLLFGTVWDEVYGLSVGGRLFRARVQYNQEPKMDAANRSIAVGILSSVSVHAER
jgi:hypothetical protein